MFRRFEADGTPIDATERLAVDVGQGNEKPSVAALDNGLAGSDTLPGLDGNDSMQGGDGSDLLSGGGGRDLLFGGAGRDTLRGAAADDKLYGGEGFDVLDGNAGNDELWGDAGQDVLSGGDGHDRIIGRGADTMTGGPGNDAFIYYALNETGDVITDFSSTGTGDNDRFEFHGAAFGGQAAGKITNSQFQNNGTSEAANANVRFIYNINTQQLFFDSDGNGAKAAVLIATLQAGATMNLNDFVIL